ncbi:MAG: oligosaccharide flippase family protein, partial [Bosea sp.]|uniref:oligosaccharide flippase family protein n=1 Tax=Bosea sp. (in: a-proteobacteria) TaxID=1871050 RepID=UPI00238F1EA7|nr:oligosaccharide flippase family protein [Bosea sp. (in: a-proteobacteria)]
MEQESRSALAKGLILVGVATLVGNGAAFLLSMVAARVLGPDDFGAFGALVGILLILVTVAIATQALAARRVAIARSGGPGANESESNHAAPDHPDIEGQLIRLAALVGLGIAVGGIIAAWPLGNIFSIPWIAVAAGIASLGFMIFGSAAMGIAQGREERTSFSIAFISLNGARAVGGIIGV